MNSILQDPPQVREAVQIARRKHPIWKRSLDLLGVIAITIVSAPLLAAVAVYIKLVSGGPILFVQSRVGYGGEDFSIFKFRTLKYSQQSRDTAHRDYVVSYSDNDSPVEKPDYDGDLIPGGNWLRRMSIDELPQLINVWLGNMSLVGPRPDVLKLEDYKSWQLRRFEVLPGITGLWQVSGKNRLNFQQMIELDIEYVETRSLAVDLRIIARTFQLLLNGDNK